MEEIFFDADSYYNPNQRKYTNISIINDLVDKISKKAEELSANKIITNGNIASVIQDSSSRFEFVNKPPVLNELYFMGKLGSTKIFVDPYMRWDDNHIHFENDNDQLVRELKLKTINKTISEKESKIRFGRVYSGFVKDNHNLLI